MNFSSAARLYGYGLLRHIVFGAETEWMSGRVYHRHKFAAAELCVAPRDWAYSTAAVTSGT